MVPTDGSKPEWNLNGQVLDMTLSLRDPVSAIKAKIAEDTGMPPGKQKLRMETIFFKDSNRSGHDRNHFLNICNTLGYPILSASLSPQESCIDLEKFLITMAYIRLFFGRFYGG